VLDGKTLGLADFVGTQGNLMDNPKAHLFLIDYTQRQRIKIWGEARIVEDKTELMARLTPEGYRARPEQLTRIMQRFDGYGALGAALV
jgi:predicted pyridoxine 5'-phosphate oxidase superfamily flavin-nucleotide-binding protein